MGVPINLNDISSGFFSADGYNANNEKIETAVGKALDRTGSTDNSMEVDLDMGLKNIFNLKKAVLGHQAVPLQQLLDFLGEGGVDSLVFMEERYIAQGGEEVFPLEVIEYTPGTNSLMVFVNEQYKRAGFEYTETGTQEITFTPALTAGDKVDIFGSKYDAQQYVNLAIVAAENAEQSSDAASNSATEASDSADIAASAAGYKLDVNNQTGVTYTLQLEDEGDFVRMDNSSENTLIVPTDSAVPFETGTVVLVRQIGEGKTTITPALGVTVNVPFNDPSIAASDFGVALVKVAANEWDMVKAFGGVSTSDLVAFTQEFDARLQDFYQEILSSDPTFVVNFDQLQNNVDSVISSIQEEFAVLKTGTNETVNNVSSGFSVIEDDFALIGNQFDTIQNDFTTIQNDFTTLQNNFDTINLDFTDIQNEFSGFQTLIEGTNNAIDTLNLDGDFSNALFEDGYQRLPGGLIMQWGMQPSVPPYTSVSTVVDFPITFPTACLNASVSSGTLPAFYNENRYRQQNIIVIKEFNQNSLEIYNMRAGDDTSGRLRPIDAYWFAIGY